MLIFGIIGAVIAGAIYPALAIIIGATINIFDPHNSYEEINRTMKILMIVTICVGVIAWFFAYVFFAFF